MKMKTPLTTICAIVALFMASCSTPPAATAPEATAPAMDMEALKVEIQAMEDAYATAEKAKDAAGVAAYYSDDAVNYNRNLEPTVGKAAITERIAERLAKDTSGTTNVYKVVDLYAEGKIAVEIGSWTEINPAGEETDKGFYMSYFEKRDGKYVCVRDMNISTKPKKETL